MHRQRSRFPIIRRKKALQRARQLFHVKCFQRIRNIQAIDIIVSGESLEPLDLAVGTLDCKRKLSNLRRLKIIRCLPPNCAEYLSPSIVFPNRSTLGQEFQAMKDFMDLNLDVLYQSWHYFVENLYIKLEKQIVSHHNFHQTLVLQIVRNYLKLVEILKPFQLGISKVPFTSLYKALLNTLCKELPVDSRLAISMGHWIRSACIDRELKASIFLSIADSTCLEYLLCVARLTRFDFWGLWSGEGGFSKKFNPVTLYFSYSPTYCVARMLLKYGFQYSAIKVAYENRLHLLANKSYRDMPIINGTNVRDLLEKREDRMMLILDILLIFINFERDVNHSDALFTLIYISRSLPYPYVTSGELFHRLIHNVQPSFGIGLMKICKKYTTEEIYDGDYRDYKPRKLVHLCRCAIRKVLAKNLKLPEGLEDLNISDYLKSYLLLEH